MKIGVYDRINRYFVNLNDCIVSRIVIIDNHGIQIADRYTNQFELRLDESK